MGKMKKMMKTLSYYKFDFDQEKDITSSFSFEQDEILLLENTQNTFKKHKIIYKCQFKKVGIWNNQNPTIIICIKDNIDLLNYTLSNLNEFEINKDFNIIIVDDRSTTNIKKIALKWKANYLRVDNSKGFNFSIIGFKSLKKLELTKLSL